MRTAKQDRKTSGKWFCVMIHVAKSLPNDRGRVRFATEPRKRSFMEIFERHFSECHTSRSHRQSAKMALRVVSFCGWTICRTFDLRSDTTGENSTGYRHFCESTVKTWRLSKSASVSVECTRFCAGFARGSFGFCSLPHRSCEMRFMLGHHGGNSCRMGSAAS